MSAPLCFIDTETTGVHPGREIWEVAMIRRNPGGSQVEHEFFVEVDLDNADPFGLSVGRFYDRHPVGIYLASGSEPAPGEVWPRGDAALTIAQVTHGAHIVGAVPNFDTESFDNLLRAHGLIPAWHYHLVDVEALAVGWLSAPGSPRRLAERELAPPWKSDDLSRACGVEPPNDDERHTALGDARWAMRLYDAITGGGES